ncbi:MAG TPA: Glu/Leu/Phe/Val dehydrogenase dimerization domain-containing protein [Actinomycetota bacterium]|nr:Glu/Leu/Phe/Val dehydrogenase dimerization domain-containing protein [Actinomycetota bacterium]
MFEDLLRGWDGEGALVRFDEPTQSWMLVCIHSTRLGPAAGGTRMKVYPSPHDALRDGLRLSTAMTSKNAVAGLPLGGGKAVLAVPEIPQGDARRELLLRYAELVASLGGTYRTACDMNTSEHDMDVVAERCPYVFGRSVQGGGSGSSAPATATGVFHGIRASVEHAFGSPDLAGRSILVQGVGAVGRLLAEKLSDAGARLVLTDVDEARATEAAAALGAETVDPQDAITSEVDVFSPCATGGVLGPETIPKLRCRVVAGAANNQLATPQDAERLAEAGILYAPDYVINAGGIIHLASLELLGEDRARLEERLRGIGDTLAEVFRLAKAEGISPGAAADRLVERRLAAGPSA